MCAAERESGIREACAETHLYASGETHSTTQPVLWDTENGHHFQADQSAGPTFVAVLLSSNDSVNCCAVVCTNKWKEYPNQPTGRTNMSANHSTTTAGVESDIAEIVELYVARLGRTVKVEHTVGDIIAANVDLVDALAGVIAERDPHTAERLGDASRNLRAATQHVNPWMNC